MSNIKLCDVLEAYISAYFFNLHYSLFILMICTQTSTQKFARMVDLLYNCIRNVNGTNMQIVTSREFRANQKKYFDLAESETVLIARRNARPILISVVNNDESLTVKELQSISKGIDDIRNGNTVEIADINNIWASIL